LHLPVRRNSKSMDFAKNTSSKAEPSQEQTKQEYNNLSAEQKKKQTYTEWLKENYNYQYERWMPWIEDQYLKWFGKGDNKASYTAKGTSTPSLLIPPSKSVLICLGNRYPQQNQNHWHPSSRPNPRRRQQSRRQPARQERPPRTYRQHGLQRRHQQS